jgi:hypothetical protein
MQNFKSFFKLWTGAYGGPGGFPRRRLEHPGARLVDARGGGDRGEYVGMLTGAKDEERRPESEVGEKSWRPTQAPMDGGAPMILRPRGGAEDVQLARKNSWWCSFARKVNGGGGLGDGGALAGGLVRRRRRRRGGEMQEQARGRLGHAAK